jgi:hypothetical protein
MNEIYYYVHYVVEFIKEEGLICLFLRIKNSLPLNF